MDNERKDEAQELYDRCNKITNISNCLFLFNIAFSFVLIFNFTYREVIAIVSLLTTIVYVLLVNINEIYFSNLAESERRKSLLKESFDVDTTLRDTNKYYNNEAQPSIEKLGLNCFESAFFTKKVVDTMLPINIIKIAILAIIYVILMIKLENMDLLLVITQTLFSAEIIFTFIKLCYYKFQLDKVCKEFQNIFLIIGLKNKESDVLILDANMDYECLKNYCKISISSKIFFENNKKWSIEWQKLLSKIQKKKEKDNSNKKVCTKKKMLK